MQLLKDTIMIRDGISVPQFSDDTSLSEHDDDAILLFYVATVYSVFSCFRRLSYIFVGVLVRIRSKF